MLLNDLATTSDVSVASDRSVRSAPSCPANPEPAQTAPQCPPRYRTTTRSPAEELAARSARWGAAEPIPDALVALLLQERRKVEVGADGISFERRGETLRFWDPGSPTCLRVGERVTFVFDPDEPDMIYVIGVDGRFVEAIPAARGVKWYDAKVQEEIGKCRQVAAHHCDRLKRLHGATTKAEYRRVKANADKLQICVALPLPGDEPAKDVDPEPPAEDRARERRTHDNDRNNEPCGFRRRALGVNDVAGRRPAGPADRTEPTDPCDPAPPLPGRRQARIPAAREIRRAQETARDRRIDWQRADARIAARVRRETGSIDDLLGDDHSPSDRSDLTDPSDDALCADIDDLL